MKRIKASVALALALAVGACAENSGPPDLSQVRVVVRDLTGSGVGSAQLELFHGTTSITTTATDYSGLASIATNETGSLELEVTPPSGYRVPTTQKSVIAFTLSSGQVKDIAFVVEKLPPDPKNPGGGTPDY